jgi:hypothetical protein
MTLIQNHEAEMPVIEKPMCWVRDYEDEGQIYVEYKCNMWNEGKGYVIHK